VDDDVRRTTMTGTTRSTTMSHGRATEFGTAWNSHDAELVASYFAEDGEYHASVGPERLGVSYRGRDEVRRGVQAFFDRFPGGRFENLRVHVHGDRGTFEWDFVTTAPDGTTSSVAGCDLLEFRGDEVLTKNAFRKVAG
jgi:ketosteroid isomerase-like protein